MKDSTRSQSFTYDLLNRLATAQEGSRWSNVYTYDAWGNLSKKLYGPVAAGEHMDTSADTGNHLLGYSYDAAGNMTSDGVNTYVYDGENRISSVAGVSYTYDADGRRVKKSSGTNYWYGPSGEALAETDSAGTWTNYVFFAGQRLARNVNGDIKYYITDHLHSTAMFADKSGTVLDDNDFYPWGGVVPGVGQTTSNNTIKFTGKERDTESGLDYFGARYYSNGMGRFITPDWAAKAVDVPYAEFSDPQSLNLYSYVRNVPTSKTDPDGHCTKDGEKHGTLWCIGHALGFTETKKEQHARLVQEARGFFAANQIIQNGKVVDTGKLSDDQAVALFNQFAADYQNASLGCGGCNVAFAFAPFMTQWGWNNSPSYIKARNEIDQPGTHEELNGKTPTREEATRMIEEKGGKVVRSEGAHGPDSVSTHNYPHINYETSSGAKATVRVKE